MSEVQGQWYDGASSRPVDVRLHADTLEKKLRIESDPGMMEWSFNDLDIDIAGTSIHIYNKSLPMQSVFTQNLPFARLLVQVSGSRKGWYYKLIHAGVTFHIFLVVFISGLIAAAYFFALPFIAEKSVDLIPVDYDRALGKTFFENYLQGTDVDSSLTMQVQDFADGMKFNTPEKFKIVVVDSDVKNAFALPGGYIVVFSGILKPMKDYPELAALLAHEGAHVEKRHSIKSIARSIAGFILISAVLGDVNGIMAVFAEHINVDELAMLAYTRSFEEQADEEGWKTLKRNNIDPDGMVNLFTRLKDDEEFSIPAFLSTHPLTETRIKTVKETIKENPYPVIRNTKMTGLFKSIKLKVDKSKKK